MTNKQIFNDQLDRDIQNIKSTLEEYRTKFVESDLLNLDYHIKLSGEEITMESFKYRELLQLKAAIEKNPDWNITKITEILNEEIEREKERVMRLDTNNSTGMYHNAESFYQLRARVQYIERYLQAYVHILTDK